MSTDPSTHRPVIGVIEWNSDKGLEPYVILADDEAGLRRAALRFIKRHLPTTSWAGNVNYIDLEWVEENPLPDETDDDAIKAWLKTFRDTTTDLWLNLYTATGTSAPPDVDGQYEDATTRT